MNWSFTLHLKVVELFSEDQVNQLYESGCSDGTLSSSKGRSQISFDRESPTLEDAIRSAIADVQKAGIQVDRLEIESDDLAEWTAQT